MATMCVIGIRLVLLSRRNQARPELYVGLSVIFGGVLGASLEAGAIAVLRQTPGASIGASLVAGKLFGLVGLLMQGLFIRMVFRPDARWATGLVAAILLLPITALLGFLSSGTFSSGVISPGWFGVELVGRLAGSVWMVFEAVRYHGLMKKRLALGLADPVVTNRFALWAWAGVCSIAMLLTSVPPAFLGPSEKALLIPDLLLFSVCGIASSLFYGLAFFPPVAYRRRLQRAVEVAS